MTRARRKPPKLTVVPLRDVSAADIAAQFRRMADELESGEIAHISSMVSVAEMDGEIGLFGWGNIDGLRAIGMLNVGMQKLTATVIEELEG